MKSRLLYLAAFDPFPPIGGGRLRVYNLLKNLLETFDIRLICLSEAHDSSQVDDFMTGRVDRVYYDRSRFKGVQGMLMGTPYEVAMFENQELRQKIEDTVKDWDPHIIWFSRTAMLQYLENLEVDGKVVLLDQHDLSRKLWRMMREGSTNLAARIVAAVNYFLIRLFEENVYRRLDLCFSVSAVEALETESFCGEDVNVTIVPNGVDIKRYSPSPQSRGESIVILGSMNQMRNVEASQYLVQKIMPEVWEKYPTISVQIVGREPRPEVLSLSHDHRVTVTGFVDDERAFLARDTIFVAPYHNGSGVKHKVLIGMAMGCPTVSTAVGMQGISAVPGTDYLHAESPAEFANEIIRLIEDPILKAKLGVNSRKVIEDSYSWTSIAQVASSAISQSLKEK